MSKKRLKLKRILCLLLCCILGLYLIQFGITAYWELVPIDASEHTTEGVRLEVKRGLGFWSDMMPGVGVLAGLTQQAYHVTVSYEGQRQEYIIDVPEDIDLDCVMIQTQDSWLIVRDEYRREMARFPVQEGESTNQ